MGTGNDNNSWGTNANVSVFQIFEDAICNVFTSGATTGTVDLSTTPPPNGPSSARFWQLLFNGSLSANLTVQVPNLTKEWIINNQCTLNGHQLLAKTPSGSSINIPVGWWRVWCDGANNMNLWPQGQLINYMPNGAASSPAYSFLAEGNSGFYRNAAHDLRITVDATDIVRFTGPLAGAPNLVDILSGNSLAFAGVKFDNTAIVPPGAELEYDGIFAPTGWYFCDGSAKTRAGDATLLAAITVATTGNTHANTTIDNLPIDLRNLGLEGAFIEGTGISLGTTIISVNSATQITVSASVSGSNTGVALRILPWGQGDGSTTFNVPDRRGRFVAGRDNMGGSTAGRLSASTSQGILGTKLNATGGEQAHTLINSELPSITPSFSGNTINLGTLTSNENYVRATGGGTSSGAGGVADDAPGQNPTTTIPPFTPSGSISSFGSNGSHNTVPPAGIANKIIKR